MSHPPSNRSDISLEKWLDSVIEANTTQGIKLDFKSTDVLEPSLNILNKKSLQIKSEVWLNADILSITGYQNSTPVSANKFFSLCKEKFPNATLSLGWTTQTAKVDQYYTWNDVFQMVQTIRCHNVTQPITFAIRGVLVKKSLPQLLWLVGATPRSTITIWSNTLDYFNISELLEAREKFPVSKIYYDLPQDQNTKFQELKNTVKSPEELDKDKFDLSIASTHYMSCETETIIGGDTVVYGGKGPIVVVLGRRSRSVVSVKGSFYPNAFDDNNKESSVKITVKTKASKSYWEANRWIEDVNNYLTFESSNGTGANKTCYISFNLTTGDGKKTSRMENSGCYAYKKFVMNYHFKLDDVLHVGLVVEGNRPAVIGPFAMQLKSNGSVGLPAINYYIIFLFFVMLHLLKSA